MKVGANHHREVRRISVLGAAILAGVTLIASLVAYTIMQRQTEFILDATLALSTQSRVNLFETGIKNSLDNAITIATRPHIIQLIKKLNAAPDSSEIRLNLKQAALSFIPTGLSALAISGADGKELIRAGAFAGRVELEAPVASPYQTTLLWKDGFVLSTRMSVLDHGKHIGEIHSEERLTSLSKMLFDAKSLGRSGELAVCAPRQSDMLCFPTTLMADGKQRLSRSYHNKLLPMGYALAGESGVINSVDYRSRPVVAAYQPVGSTGLGMVLKLDRAELYLPIKRQSWYVAPLVIMLVAAGVLLLNWLVAPLLRKLVVSERETRMINVELSNSEARLRAIFNSVDDGIVTINASGIIESINPAIVATLGYRKEEVIGKNVSMLMPEPHRSNHDEYIRHYLTTGQARIIGVGREVEAQRKDGTTLPIELRINEMTLQSGRFFIATLRDISARKQAEQRILHLATHDPLTDLPNRNLLNDRIAQAITQASRRNSRVAVLFLDMDGFKFINDTHGHDVGDQLLIEVAQRIKRMLRNEDTIARQGGDEFIVALPDIDAVTGVIDVAQKLLKTLSVPYKIQGQQLDTSASIGISLYPDDGDDAETLIRKSDAAMYSAKKSGRNRYVLLSSSSASLPVEI